MDQINCYENIGTKIVFSLFFFGSIKLNHIYLSNTHFISLFKKRKNVKGLWDRGCHNLKLEG